MVTDVPVDAGPNIAVLVNVGPGVVPAGRETGTVRDVPVNAELPVRREVDAGGVKFDREIVTEVDAVRGVPVDVGLGVVPVRREIGTEVDAVHGVPVVPVNMGPGIVPVASPRRRGVR